ncbi:MAG: xanthine dehydrogenase family protein molybdopterin-binding subunit, partial [Pseudomonadota bacterium]|nr:xanthine dehydrogenase family protein molybdopterin-binding subunit [Pseudomonadota bacterium]
MTIQFGNPDRPNSYIGKTVPRPNARRLVQGRGVYVDDIVLPRMVHVAFVRSPFAHAKINRIDAEDAKSVKGVLRVFTGQDIAEVCKPWVAVLAHLKGLKSPPEHAIAVDRACWVGEPVAAVVATSRAAAEVGAALVDVDYEQLDVVTDMMTALDPDTPVLHPEMGDNLAFRRLHEQGDVDETFRTAH